MEHSVKVEHDISTKYNRMKLEETQQEEGDDIM